jgi:serine/threonine protein kinase
LIERIVKVVDPAFGSPFTEFDCLRTLDHPGIIKVHKRGWTRDRHFFFEMDRVVGLPLHEWIILNCGIGAATEERIRWRCFLEIVQTVSYLHWSGWLHGDLRPENILVDERSLRCTLIDFEFARRSGDSGRHGKRQHSLDYASPEEQYGHEAFSHSEQYSLAMIGKLFLEPTSESRALDVATNQAWHSLLERALSKNPSHRFDDVCHFSRELRREYEKTFDC